MNLLLAPFVALMAAPIVIVAVIFVAKKWPEWTQ
jgi:hypothetical protein